MRCDIVVVGAGPGGSTAAYWSARFGADVILVDKARFPRNKPCGDGLVPGVDQMLESMGLGDFIHARGRPFHGIQLFGPEGRRTKIDIDSEETSQPGQGWVIPRHVLDDALRQNAISAGARYLSEFKAQEPIYDGDRLNGVSGKVRGSHIQIEAPLMILATGANRCFLQTLGLSSGGRPDALAMRLYVTRLHNLDDCLLVYLERELLPGYGWVFPTGDASANVGCGVVMNQMSTSEASRRLRAVLGRMLESEQLSGGIIQDRPQGYPLRTDFPEVPLFSDGLLVVGEMAGLVDPIVCDGISAAVRSGWLAAKIADQAMSAGDFSALQLGVYGDILQEWYADYFRDAQQLMAWFGQPGVVDALISQVKSDPRIIKGLKIAILEKSPYNGMIMLKKALGEI